MAPREGSVPVVDVRHRLDPRPPAGLRPPAGPDGAGDRGRPPAAAGGSSRRRSTSRRRRGSTTPTSTSTTTSAASPCPSRASMRQLLDLATLIAARPVRPHPAAVAVRRRRGPARRQGGARAEDAPHDHRRRGRRADVAAVPRLRARRARPAAARPAEPSTSRRRRRRRSAAETRPRPPRRRVPAAARRRPPGQRAARRPDRDPRRRARPPSTRCAASSRSSADIEQARSPLWTERSLRRHLEVVRAPFRETKDAAKRLGGTLNTAFLTAAAEAAGALPRRARRAGRARCGRRWRSAPAPSRPAPTPSRWPGCSCRPATMPIAERFAADPGERRRGPRRAAAARRSRRSPPSPPRCRRRSSPGSPASRRRPSTSPRRTCAASPVPVYIAGAQLLENYPSARSPAWRSTSRCCPTSAASTWASTSTPPRWPSRSGWPRSLERAFKDLVARLTAAPSDGQTCSGSTALASSAACGRRAAGRRPRPTTPARGCIICAERLVDHGERFGDHGVVGVGRRSGRAARSSPRTVPARRRRARRTSASRAVTDGVDAYDARGDGTRRIATSSSPVPASGIGAALARRFHADGARVVVADLAGAERRSPTSSAAAPSASSPTSSTEAGNVALIERGRGGVRPDRPVLRQRRHRRRHRPRRRPRRTWQQAFDVNVNAHRWAAKHLLPGWLARGEGYFCSTASAAGLLAQIGSAPYTRHQARRRGVRRVAVDHLRRPRASGSAACARRASTPTCSAAATRRSAAARDVVRAAGVVLEPERGRRRRRRRDRRRALPDPPPPGGARRTCGARPTTPTAGWPACASCRPACSGRRPSARSTGSSAVPSSR